MSQWIRTERRHAIYARDGYRCAYCGYSMKSQRHRLTLDHILPRAMGGSNRNSNLITCCDTCNTQKGKKSLNQFATWCKVNNPARNVYWMRTRVQRWRRRVVKYA